MAIPTSQARASPQHGAQSSAGLRGPPALAWLRPASPALLCALGRLSPSSSAVFHQVLFLVACAICLRPRPLHLVLHLPLLPFRVVLPAGHGSRQQRDRVLSSHHCLREVGQGGGCPKPGTCGVRPSELRTPTTVETVALPS